MERLLLVWPTTRVNKQSSLVLLAKLNRYSKAPHYNLPL